MLHVAVYAYKDISDVSLVCTVELGTPVTVPPPESTLVNVTVLENNVWTPDLFAAKGETIQFKFVVPPGAVSVRAHIWHGMGEAALYATFDRPNAIGLGEPTNGCVSSVRFQDQVCQEKLLPVGDVLYVSVHGKTDFVYAKVKCVAFH